MKVHERTPYIETTNRGTGKHAGNNNYGATGGHWHLWERTLMERADAAYMLVFTIPIATDPHTDKKGAS
jgi:hypothetical protein